MAKSWFGITTEVGSRAREHGPRGRPGVHLVKGSLRGGSRGLVRPKFRMLPCALQTARGRSRDRTNSSGGRSRPHRIVGSTTLPASLHSPKLTASAWMGLEPRLGPRGRLGSDPLPLTARLRSKSSHHRRLNLTGRLRRTAPMSRIFSHWLKPRRRLFWLGWIPGAAFPMRAFVAAPLYFSCRLPAVPATRKFRSRWPCPSYARPALYVLYRKRPPVRRANLEQKRVVHFANSQSLLRAAGILPLAFP